jgi:hypothetical protein
MPHRRRAAELDVAQQERQRIAAAEISASVQNTST